MAPPHAAHDANKLFSIWPPLGYTLGESDLMPTYKIIGADGKEYGPITAEQMHQWIAEGRLNAQSQVLVEGTTDWRRVGDLPEFASTLPIAPPPLPSGAPPLGAPPVRTSQVDGPAIGLIVVGILNFLTSVAALLMHTLGTSMMPARDFPNQAWVTMMSGTIGIISNILGILISGLILFGAIKMKRLESYGLAMTSTILAMIPCTSPCCLVGLPIGIWALVILAKPEVKAAFR